MKMLKTVIAACCALAILTGAASTGLADCGKCPGDKKECTKKCCEDAKKAGKSCEKCPKKDEKK